MRIRTEDGGFFETTVPGAPVVSVSVWERVRLESGEDVLVGPATIANRAASAEARLGPGDVSPLTVGTAP